MILRNKHTEYRIRFAQTLSSRAEFHSQPFEILFFLVAWPIGKNDNRNYCRMYYESICAENNRTGDHACCQTYGNRQNRASFQKPINLFLIRNGDWYFDTYHYLRLMWWGGGSISLIVSLARVDFSRVYKRPLYTNQSVQLPIVLDNHLRNNAKWTTCWCGILVPSMSFLLIFELGFLFQYTITIRNTRSNMK